MGEDFEAISSPEHMSFKPEKKRNTHLRRVRGHQKVTEEKKKNYFCVGRHWRKTSIDWKRIVESWILFSKTSSKATSDAVTGSSGTIRGGCLGSESSQQLKMARLKVFDTPKKKKLLKNRKESIWTRRKSKRNHSASAPSLLRRGRNPRRLLL